jgi:hypothetical protein
MSISLGQMFLEWDFTFAWNWILQMFLPGAVDPTVGRSKALAEFADMIPFLYLIGLGSKCKNNKI